MIGISGESLSAFAIIYIKYLRNRRILGSDKAEMVPAKKSSAKRKKAAPKTESKRQKEKPPVKEKKRGKFERVEPEKPKREKKADKPKKEKQEEKEESPKCINPVADALPIEKIANGIIYTKDHRYVKIIEVIPINFLLRSYREQKNIEKVLDDNAREEDALWEIFANKHHGRVCRHQAYFNRSEKKWYMRYDPMTCSHYGCSYCTLLDKPISAKKANVYYDLKKSFVRKGQGFMPDETVVTVIKGIKLLRASETVCDAIIKCCKKDIEDTVRLNNHSFCFFGGTIEVQNLRYEHRESRDLLQDLQDVTAGITVIHESDRKKAEKKTKQERRAAAQQRRKNRFRKLIQTNGLLGLSASDRNRAKKHLSEAEIQEANRLHEISLLPPPDMQMSMEGCL